MITRGIHKFCGAVSSIHTLLLCTALLFLYPFCINAQFSPVVGYPGTTAIRWDSSAIIGWATGCTIQRGYRDIAIPDSGYATDGDSNSAIGPATQNGTVSLGDGGIAILTFSSPIVNGPGFDFAVFENGFDAGPPGMAFLELAFIEVSSDGVRYVRFPTTDNVQDTLQIGLGPMDGSKLNNLAGKYIYGYGTPFDLDELRDSVGLDVNNITHVKVIDVVGSINPVHGTHDSRGHMINDPYPTNYASSGFDLDAVGVINQKGAAGISQTEANTSIQVYPNPFSDFVIIHNESKEMNQVQVTDISGRMIKESSFQYSAKIYLNELPAGVYNIRVTNGQDVFSKLIIKE